MVSAAATVSICDNTDTAIRSGRTIEEIGDKLSKLHSLPRSNVVAHYGSAQLLDMDGLCDLLSAQAAVVPGSVCDAINDVREEIALGRVDREAVGEALSKLLDRQTKAVIERLGFKDEAIDLFDRFVSKVVAGADSTTLFRLDVYVRMFSQMAAAELSNAIPPISALSYASALSRANSGFGSHAVGSDQDVTNEKGKRRTKTRNLHREHSTECSTNARCG
jgi:hypothetical protein